MDRRQQLHLTLLKAPEVEEAYFQPPESLVMVYPCIRYNREDARLGRADNLAYRFTQRYTIIVITRNPDSPTPKWLVENLPMCTIDRNYVADNLYHTALTLYY